MSPTQLSIKKLNAEGYTVGIVEHWNPHVPPHGIRQDLFGCLDLLAVNGRRTLGVQTTSGSNVAPRIRKLLANTVLPLLLGCGWIVEIHGWRKVKVKRGGKLTRWECRVVTVDSSTWNTLRTKYHHVPVNDPDQQELRV